MDRHQTEVYMGPRGWCGGQNNDSHPHPHTTKDVHTVIPVTCEVNGSLDMSLN